MKVFQKLSPSVRQNLLILFTAGLLFWSGLAAHLPTLPLYIESLGASEQMVGIVMGSFAIGLLGTREWFAKLADQRGRQLVMLIGMMAVAVAPLGYLLSGQVLPMIGLRAFHGISIAAFALAYSALVVDFSPPQHRGELIGYMSLVGPIGMALGPALGGYIYEWFGFAPMFLFAAGLGLLGLICTAQVQEPQLATDDRTNAAETKQFWRLLANERIRTPAIVLLLAGLTFGTLSTFTPLYIREAGVNLNPGLFFSATAILGFGIRLLVGPASDRHGRGLFISFSLVLYTLSMLLLWQARSATTFLLAAAIEGAGAGTLIPMMAALMADRSQPHERGRTFGVCMIGFDAGIALAGPLFGAIVADVGYRGIFGICAGLTLLGLLIFLTQSSKNLTYSLRFASGRGADLYAINFIDATEQISNHTLSKKEQQDEG